MQKVLKKKRDKEPYPSNNSFWLGICIGIMISAAISVGVVSYYKQKQRNQQDLKEPSSNHLLHTQGQQKKQEQLNELIPLADLLSFDEEKIGKKIQKNVNDKNQIFNDTKIIDSGEVYLRPPIKRYPGDTIKNEKNLNVNLEIGARPITQKVNTHQECLSKYGKRAFFKDVEKRLPPMLYTFPGSGNTWIRLLIEYGTGIYSGSVYNDNALMDALPAEFTCNWKVSVIKVHPTTHAFKDLKNGGFRSDGGLKCTKGKVLTFKRAVLLIRNPFDSIWSEFQRRVSKSHVGGIDTKAFDWSQWQAHAASLASDYKQMWTVQYTGIEHPSGYAKEDIIYIKYEDLKNETTRVQEMQKLADFLGILVTPEQLACSFVLASRNTTHRISTETSGSGLSGSGSSGSGLSGFGSSGSGLSGSETSGSGLMMTKAVAYTKKITCKMWAQFGSYVMKHGYAPYNDYDCSVEDTIGKTAVTKNQGQKMQLNNLKKNKIYMNEKKIRKFNYEKMKNRRERKGNKIS